MTPAAGGFGVVAFMNRGIRLMCPECGEWVDPDPEAVWPDIRDLIAAASEHARTTHAMSEVNA